jgi:cysteine desulfurase
MGMINKCIYFDNNATTRTDPAVLEAMLPYFGEHYGNASSRLHPHGWIAKAAVEKGIAQLANLIHCAEDELIITSGATEAVNLALSGLFETYKGKGNHIITVKTEHKAVLDTCEALKEKGAEISYLDVNPEGLIDLDELKKQIKSTTILVSVMAGNNETGVIQDLEKIAELCNESGLIFFSDATQYIGKMRCDVVEIGIHAMALSAHKFYGPKGVGALYISRRKPRLNLLPQIYGGGHQNGFRSGTLNVPGIVGMGKAAELAANLYWEESSRISALRGKIEHRLLDIEGLRINGSTRSRLYNTSNLTFPKNYDLSKLFHQFAFSLGSACSSGSNEPSHVLKAMGVSNEDINNSFRFSLGRFTTETECDNLLNLIASCC